MISSLEKISRVTSGKYCFIVLKTYTLFVALLSSMEILRLTGIFNIAKLNGIIIVFVSICCVVGYVSRNGENKLRLPRICVLLLFLSLISFLVGFSYSNNKYYILSESITVFSAVAITVLYSSSSFERKNLYCYLNWSSRIIVFFCLIGLLVSYVAKSFFSVEFYSSVGSVIMLVPFSFFLIYKKQVWFLITLILILLGAKLGVTLAVFSIIFFHYVSRFKLSLLLTLLAWLTGIVVGVYMVDLLINSFTYSPTNWFSGILGKIKNYSISNAMLRDDFEWISLGGGRVMEVVFSLKEMSTFYGLPWLTGAGFGFTYDAYYIGQNFKDVHNVHLTPITLYIRHGVIGVGLIYIFLFLTLSRLHYRFFIERSEFLECKVFLLVIYGSLIFSLTAFNLFATLFNWFFIGILLSMAKYTDTLVKD